MANYVWPELLLPNSFTLKRFSQHSRSRSVYGGSGQTIHLMNDRWVGSLSVSLMAAAKASAFEGFLNKLRMGSSTVELHHFSRPEPAGNVQGSGVLSSDVSQGSTSFPVVVGPGETLKAGDMFGVDGLLFSVAEDCAADGSGDVVITSTFPTRRALNEDALVLFSSPRCRFRLDPTAPPLFDYGPNSVVSSVVLDFVEAIP